MILARFRVVALLLMHFRERVGERRNRDFFFVSVRKHTSSRPVPAHLAARAVEIAAPQRLVESVAPQRLASSIALPVSASAPQRLVEIVALQRLAVETVARQRLLALCMRLSNSISCMSPSTAGVTSLMSLWMFIGTVSSE